MANGKPYLPNLQAYYGIGMDPKTGLPLKMIEGNNTKQDVKRMLRLVDEQDAINRYTWYNLPDGLNTQLLERIIYYRGQGMFFYMEANDKFYFLPYALDGNIDVYGRFTGVTPLPFNGGAADKEGKIKPWITGLVRKPLYDVVLPEELDIDTFRNGAVLLKDYTEQQSETIISRQIINEGILDVTAECIPFMRTALIKASGVAGMRVGNVDEQANVIAANAKMKNAALNGDPYIPIVGAVDFQNMNEGNVAKSEEFMLAMESLDNFRLASMGLENGGLFQKKAHMLQDEQNMAAGTVGLVLQDGLTQRQRFCDIVNSIWGLGIWCDVSETASGMDKNGDGEISEQQDQTGTAEGEQDVMEGENE